MKSKFNVVCIPVRSGEVSSIRTLSLLQGFSELQAQCDVYCGYAEVQTPPPGVKFHSQSVLKKHGLLFNIVYFFYALAAILSSKPLLILSAPLPVLILAGYLKRGPLFLERTENPNLLSDRSFKSRFLRYWYIHRCKHYTGLFAISERLKKLFAKCGVPEEKIRVIRMTVDSNRFDRLARIPSDEKYIAYCGTVSTYKDGVNVLIRAFLSIAARYPRIRLKIIGPMQDEHVRRELEQILDSAGEAGKRVDFTGKVRTEEMPQLLKNAEILALARPANRQAAYGFPTKLGEYLLTGNPVVVTRVGELDTFLKDKESVVFAEPGNMDDFAEKLSWVLDHPGEAAEIGRNGRRTALESFHYRTEARKMLDFMENSMSKKTS